MRGRFVRKSDVFNAAPAQPRTSQTTSKPTTAEPMPIARNVASGVSSTLATARLAWPGKAAKTSPSIMNTRPTAARKSYMPAGSLVLLASRLRCRRGRAGGRGRRCRTRLARRIVEVTEEVGVRLEHQPGIVALECVLVSLHRAVEGEEIRVLVEGVGENLVSGRVALAADLLGLRCRFGDQHGHLTVGPGADF